MTFRVLSCILALFFVGAGVVPASTACFDSCGCYKQDIVRHHGHRSAHAGTHNMDMSAYKNLNPFRYILIDTPPSLPVCGTQPVNTCGLKISQLIGVLNRTNHGLVQSDTPYQEPILQIAYETAEEEDPITGPGLKWWYSTGYPPVPLYLKNLSLIC